MHMILDLPIRNASCNSIIVIMQNNLPLNKIISKNVGTYTQQNVMEKKDTKQYEAKETNISTAN